MEIREINSRKFKLASEADRAKAKEKILKAQKEGEKLVKGMFEFLDAQGGWLDFAYRFYPGEPIRNVKITHGEIVDLPMDLVKHLNNTFKKVRNYNSNFNLDTDKPTISKISRTRFTPLEMF